MSAIAVAVVGGVATVAGAYMQSQATKDAADAQVKAADKSLNAQRDMYSQTREDNEPWRQAGIKALGDIQNGNILTNFQGDPGYAFRMQEGQKAINAAASARGMSNSGGALKSLARYGQDYASNEYNNAYNRQYNRLSALAGIGQNAAGQNQAAGQNYVNQATNSYGNIGNAQAASSIGQANAYNNAIGSGTNSWMQFQMMNRMFPKNTVTNEPNANYGSAGQTYFGSGTIA